MVDGSRLSDTKCPQQGNGFDCGPYTLLFTERVIEKINTNEDITPIHVKTDDVKRYRSNLQKLIDEEIKSKNEGNKDSQDPKDNDKNKNSKSVTNHGTCGTGKDPKDKNNDKNSKDDISHGSDGRGNDDNQRNGNDRPPAPGNNKDAGTKGTVGDNDNTNGNKGVSGHRWCKGTLRKKKCAEEMVSTPLN